MKSAKSYRIMQFTLEELCLGGQTKDKKLRVSAETLKTLLFPKVRFTERCKLSRDTEAIEYASKAAITIPYNAALRQIYLLREEAKAKKEKIGRTREEILESAYTGPLNKEYFLQDIIYVDLNAQSGSGGSERVNQLLNGLVIEFDKRLKTDQNGTSDQNTAETAGERSRYEIEYVVFERSASQQRQNMLVMIRKDQFEQKPAETADVLENRIRCGIPADHSCVISKYSAYRALMLTSGICVDAKEFLNQDSILVVSDYQIGHWRNLCKKYDLFLDTSKTKRCATVTCQVTEDDPYVRNISYADSDEPVRNDKLFDGEGLISPEFGDHLSKVVLEQGGSAASSYQIRMPFVKGVVHTVDFRSIFKEIFLDKELREIMIWDAFGKKRSIDNVHMILTVSMFKMYHAYSKLAKDSTDSSGESKKSKAANEGFSEYWKAYIKGEHRLFVSGCDEVFRSAPEFTISNYQFLSTLEESAAGGQDRRLALTAPSLNAVWTTAQSCDSQAVSYVMRSRIPADLLDSGGNEADQTAPPKGEEKEMQERVSDAKLLYRCPQLAHTSVFKEKMKRDHLAADLSIGHLIQPGTMRYLSGDLLQFCCLLADNISCCAGNPNRFSGLMPWMLEAVDGVVPLHTCNDGLDKLFSPDAEHSFARLCRFMQAVIAEQDKWDDADASDAEKALFRRMKHAFLSRKKDCVFDPEEFVSSEEFTRKTKQRERRKLLNKRLLEADISGAGYYAPGAPEKRAVIDRNPHLARNEHVVLDPMAAGELRRKYFGHLKGVVMLRVGRDRNVQRLGGADFDGDIVRLFYDPAYIAAAEKSCSLSPLVIPGVETKHENYDAEARCELVRRSSGSRVGNFSNLAFRTSLLAYGCRTGNGVEKTKTKDKTDSVETKAKRRKRERSEEWARRSCAENAERDLIRMSCLVGLEIDAVKTGKKPKYTSEEMFLFECYPSMAGSADPAHLNYFLSYKDRMKKYRGMGKVEFPPMSEEIGHYSLVEHLPYIFNPQLLEDTKAIPEKTSKGDAAEQSHWARQCHQLLWEKPDRKKNFQHRRDPLTEYQPDHKYLFGIVGGEIRGAELAPELRAAFCAAAAREQLLQRNNVESDTSAKIHTIRRLLAVWLGMNTGSIMAAKVEEFVGHFKNEQEILEMIFRLLPWGSYPNAELRRTHFNMLCQEKGLDFHTDQDDDFDALCCNLDLYVTDHDQLLRILLEHSEAEILGKESAEGKDTEPKSTGQLPEGFGQKELTGLRNALWECNTMSALRRTEEAIGRIDETSAHDRSFEEIADAYGLCVPKEDALLKALTQTWNADARRNLCSALTTFPSARKQAEKIFHEMIRKSRKITADTQISEEADLRLLGCIHENAAEERKLAGLWKQCERLCRKLHSAGVIGGYASADECLREMAKEIYTPRQLDWFREENPTKREEYVKTLLSEYAWDLLQKQNSLKNLICNPQCWQLLPAILNYARSVSATNARQENRRKFRIQTEEIFDDENYPYSAACVNPRKEDTPDLAAAVREIVQAYQEDRKASGKKRKLSADKIAAADTKQTIDLLTEWASMPQDSVVKQDDMVVFSKKELSEAQKAENERQGNHAENQETSKEKRKKKAAGDELTANKLKIDRLTADLFRLLHSCKIEGLKHREMVRIMFDAICTILYKTEKTAKEKDTEVTEASAQNTDVQLNEEEKAERARRKQIFRKLLAAEKYAAVHPGKSGEKVGVLQRFICNYYSECLEEALPPEKTIVHEEEFQPNYECGFVDGCQGIVVNASGDVQNKYKNFSVGLTITTRIGGESEKPEKILEGSVKCSSSKEDLEISVALLDPELTAASADMLWLYSIPFEIRAGGEQLATGALTHLRLPQTDGKTDPDYADLAKQPLTLNAVIKCDAKGKVTVKRTEGGRYNQKLEIKKPLDSFVWGYRKYRRNAGTDTVKEDANDD